MARDGEAGMYSDPLRDARQAVRQGRFRDAAQALQAAPADARATPEALLLSAMTAWRLGDFGRSRGAAVQARDGFRTRGDTDGEMRAENVAAAGAFALGDLQEAERGFTRALYLADALADDLMMARCANNLGNVAYYLSRADAALSFYRLAVANFERLTFWAGLAEGWLNSAIVLHDAGDLRASREAGERAVEAAERSGDGRILGQALAARSETDVALGDMALGRALAERALTLARSHDHPMGAADALRILASIARLSGDADRALAVAQEALAITTRVQDPWRQAEVHRELGQLYAAVGRLEDAALEYVAAAGGFQRLGAEGRALELRDRAAALRG
jgi:tetratricopeptide (TPR) repeat protein